MTDDIVLSADVVKIAQVIGSLITGGGVASVAGALQEIFKLINYLTGDDPVKRAKARRLFFISMMQIIKEIPNVPSKDVSDLAILFTQLLDH